MEGVSKYEPLWLLPGIRQMPKKQSVIFNIIWGYGIIGWLAVSSLTMATDRMFNRKGNYFIPLWV